MISICINVDSRPGSDSDVNTTGDHGPGSLQGVRSYDFFTEGVRDKIKFFSGYTTEVIVYCDLHEPLPESVQSEIHEMIRRGEIDTFICQPHERQSRRYNERLYLNCLRIAKGDYVAHFDQDCAAFRDPNCDIVGNYLYWLNEGGYQFVCQPTTLTLAEHKMYWASTRFFICKRETLDFGKLDEAVTNEGARFAKYGHAPALEHVLGRMGGVFYPPFNPDEYLIWSWARYHKGVLPALNRMPFEAVRDYVMKTCGAPCGPMDLLSLPIL